MKKPSKKPAKTVTVRCDVVFTIEAEVKVAPGKEVWDYACDISDAVTQVWDSARKVGEDGVDGVKIVDSVDFGATIVEVK